MILFLIMPWLLGVFLNNDMVARVQLNDVMVARGIFEKCRGGWGGCFGKIPCFLFLNNVMVARCSF